MKFSSLSLGRFALQWAVFGLSASIMVVIVSVVYATASWGSLPTVNTGSGLTATAWNDLVAHVNQSVKQSSQVITVSGASVGIGTVSPTWKLMVDGSDRSRSRLGYNDGVRDFGVYQSDLGGGSGNAPYNYFQNNIGIGTTSPSERLDLWGGNIKMGYELVVTNIPLGNAVTWYWAACPVGKVVIGGSCSTGSGNDPTNTSISGNSYGCYKSSMLTNYQITAVCANMK